MSKKDPLLIYKLESFGLFKKMIDAINYKAIAILMRGQIPVKEGETLREPFQICVFRLGRNELLRLYLRELGDRLATECPREILLIPNPEVFLSRAVRDSWLSGPVWILFWRRESL